MGVATNNMKRIQLENRTDLKSEIPLEAPYSIFIDPSSECNFKCNFCMNSKIKDKSVMEFKTYKKIIDDLQEFENPIKTIRLYGFGEPLLNPNFCKMVEYAKASDKILAVDTTTNASLLSRTLNENLIKSGIDRINISIEGVSKKQYRDFTGKPINFIKLVENIKHLYSIRKKTIIFIKIAGDYLTEKEKKEFYEIFEPISDGCDIEHTINCWYDLEIEKNNKVGIYGQPLEDIDVCPYIFYSMMIQSDGRVSTCFLDWNKKMTIGSIKNDSVRNVWNNKNLKNFQLMMLQDQRKMHPICSNCDQLKAGMPVDLDPYRKEILKRIKK